MVQLFVRNKGIYTNPYFDDIKDKSDYLMNGTRYSSNHCGIHQHTEDIAYQVVSSKLDEKQNSK